MFDIQAYKKSIETEMEKTDKAFDNFIKIICQKKADVYVHLAGINLSEPMLATTILLNKLEYMEVELKGKIDKMPFAEQNHQSEKTAINNDKKEKKKGKKAKKNDNDSNKFAEEENSEISANRSKMILELYDISHLHQAMSQQWREKVIRLTERAAQVIDRLSLQQCLQIHHYLNFNLERCQ